MYVKVAYDNFIINEDMMMMMTDCISGCAKAQWPNLCVLIDRIVRAVPSTYSSYSSRSKSKSSVFIFEIEYSRINNIKEYVNFYAYFSISSHPEFEFCKLRHRLISISKAFLALMFTHLKPML